VGVRVRLSPEEAEAVWAAASRAGLSVGAWVADIAVSRARGELRGTVEQTGPSSWRELVAALVALRTEVVGVRDDGAVETRVAVGDAAAGPLVPAVPLGSPSDAGEPSEARPEDGSAELGGFVGLLRRIDAATEAATVAAASGGRGASRGGRRRPSGPS
jgi:hypothetical protein